MHCDKLKVCIVLALFLIQNGTFISNLSFETSTTNLSKSNSTISNNSITIQDPHTLQTNIIMLNYANLTNLIDGIANELPPLIVVQNGAQKITYKMVYHFIFPNSNFTTNFTNFINSVSTPNSPTVDINQTALAYQAVHNSVQNIFINKSGTAINGTAVESWLWANGQQFKTANISYQIFLLNLTFIPDKLYWFNIPEPDEVTHQQRQEWRLEWDYPPFNNINNYNVKFPYPGYSSRYPMYYLDPSAFNWYLNWTRVWRNVPKTSNYREYLNSFSEYVQQIGGLINQTNQVLAGTFIGDWLNEIVTNLFIFKPLNYVYSPSSVTLQIAVITDETNSNPYPDLHWIINDTIVKTQLQQVLPNSTITTEVTFYNLSLYPDVQTLLNQNKVSLSPSPMLNYTYYDGYNLSSYFPTLDSEFFNHSSSALVIRGYILILDNASFTGAKWNGGGLFTGLGGGGRLLILNDIDRLFFNRTTNPIPKESLSKVLIHETGHAIGFPHPFNEPTNSYASDFLGDVMGYYPSTANFSVLFIDNFQRLSLESKINMIFTNLQQLVKINLSNTYINNLLILYNNFMKAYHDLDFQSANNNLNQLQTLMEQQIVLEPGGISPPLIVSYPTIGTLYFGQNLSLIWHVYDMNPSNYIIFVNNSEVKEGSWNVTSVINYTFSPASINSYNVSLIVYDRFQLFTTKSIIIKVIENSNSTYISNSNVSSAELNFYFTIVFPIFLYSILFFYRKKRNRF